MPLPPSFPPHFTRSGSTRYGGGSAFSLLELLVSFSLLILLSVILLQMTDSTARVTSRVRGSIDTFQGARAAFETITRRLSQATLHTINEYDDPLAPTRYRRFSQLHFISARAETLLEPGWLGGVFAGHAVFFQFPGGYNPNQGTDALPDLLNACGYLIAFCPEETPELGLLPSIPGWSAPHFPPRFRLIEALEPSADLSVYQSGESPQWIEDLCANERTRLSVLADDVILLAFLPRLPLADDVSGVALAPAFRYDSRADTRVECVTASGETIHASSLHQLPPMVEVVMVALAPESARRLADQFGEAPPDLGTLSGDPAQPFSDPALFEEQLSGLTRTLSQRKLVFRLFRTTVVLKGAKWSQDQ